jgi:septal ring factor EnvC (AmiA/AmiB activator)
MNILPRFGWCVAALALGCAPVLAADSGDLQQQLTDAQDRLSTALRSYSLLQDENAKLKDQIQADASDKTGLQAQLDQAKQANDALKASAAEAAKLEGVREQLRQARDQIAELAQENYQLKAQLSAALASRR